VTATIQTLSLTRFPPMIRDQIISGLANLPAVPAPFTSRPHRSCRPYRAAITLPLGKDPSATARIALARRMLDCPGLRPGRGGTPRARPGCPGRDRAGAGSIRAAARHGHPHRPGFRPCLDWNLYGLRWISL
jgi:hypothetical protein